MSAQRKREIEWRAWHSSLDIKIKPREAVSSLLRKHVLGYCQSKGLVREANGDFVYFPSGLLPENKMHFTGYDGKRTYVKVVGERAFRTAIGRERSRYHLAFTVNPIFRFHQPALRLSLGFHLTDLDGRDLPDPRASRRRRTLGKTLWNHQWLSRLMACAAWLSGEQPFFTVLSQGDVQLSISGELRTLTAPGGFDETQLESTGSPDEEEELVDEENDEDESDESSGDV